jgi:hypothetical protein
LQYENLRSDKATISHEESRKERERKEGMNVEQIQERKGNGKEREIGESHPPKRMSPKERVRQLHLQQVDSSRGKLTHWIRRRPDESAPNKERPATVGPQVTHR